MAQVLKGYNDKVAGAIAEAVGMDLLSRSTQVIVENGGDVFIKADDLVLVGVDHADGALQSQHDVVIQAGESHGLVLPQREQAAIGRLCRIGDINDS